MGTIKLGKEKAKKAAKEIGSAVQEKAENAIEEAGKKAHEKAKDSGEQRGGIVKEKVKPFVQQVGKMRRRSCMMQADPSILYEEKNLRRQNEKSYRRNNGTIKSIITNHAMHYLEEDGSFGEIDHTLQDKGEIFETKQGKYTFALAKNTRQTGTVSMKSKDVSIEWNFISQGEASACANIAETEEEISGKKLGDTVVYENAEESVDLVYDISGENVKEKIIVRERKEGEYKYYFELKINGVAPRLSEDGNKIEFYREATDKAGVKQEIKEAEIPAPFMYDAKGERNESVYYELEQREEGSYLFIVVADEEWLNAEERAFPVVIDPQIVTNDCSFFTVETERKFSYGSLGQWTEFFNHNYNGYIYASKDNSNILRSSVKIDLKRLNLQNYPIAKATLILHAQRYDSEWIICDSIRRQIKSDNTIEIDITSKLRKASDFCQILFEAYSTGGYLLYAEGSLAPRLEIEYMANDSVNATEKEIPLCDGVVASANMHTGECVISFEDVSASDSLLGVGISHLHKLTGEEKHCGKNFRLNLQEKFYKNADGTLDANYIYVDAAGIKHGFKDLYYYLDSDNHKVYVKKSHITVGLDQSLTYNEKKIYKEQYSTTGLKAITRLEDFINNRYLEQRQEEVLKCEENIKQLNKQKEQYTHNIQSYEKEKERLNTQKLLYQKQKRVQRYSNNIQDTQLKIEDYKRKNGYFDKEKTYNALIRKNEFFNNAEILYRYEKDDLSSVCSNSFSDFIESTYIRSATDFDSARQKVFAGHGSYVEDNADKNAEIKEVFNYHYLKLISDKRYELQRLSELSQEQYTEYGPSVKDYIYQAQKDIVNLQNEMLQEQYDTDFNSQIAEADYLSGIANRELEEIEISLRQAEYRLAQLKRQVPVHYLTDGQIVKGFNESGDLAVIYNQYNNAYYVLYDDGGKIAEVYDGKHKRIAFTYNANDLLSSITDTRGRVTKYEYFDGENEKISGSLKSVRYANGKTLSFEYDDFGNLTQAHSSNGLKSELSYESGLKSVDNYSNTGAIVHGKTTPNGADVLLNSVSLAYSESRTVLTDERGDRIYYHFDDDGNLSEYYEEAAGLITKGEKYSFIERNVPDSSHKERESVTTESIPEQLLNRYPYASEALAASEIVTTTFDQFYNPVKTVESGNRLSAQTTVEKTTVYEYDDERRCIKEKTQTQLSGGAAETYTAITTYAYNAAGSLVRKESWIEGEELTSGKTVEERVYDKDGNEVKTFTYNSLDTSSKFYKESVYSEERQVTAEKDETGEVSVEYEYVEGTTVVRGERRANGSRLAYGHDIDDTVTAITQSTAEGEENSTQIGYTLGEVTELKSGNTAVRYEYDEKHRKTAVDLNGAKHYETYCYEEGETENTVTVTNRKGETFTSVSDKRGNVLRKLYNGAEEVRYTYNEDGNMLTATEGENVASCEYDAFGNVTAYRRGEYAERRIYDAYGCVTEYDQNGRVYAYAYKEEAGRSLAGVTVEGFTVSPKNDLLGRNVGKEITANGTKLAGEYVYYRKAGDYATNMPSAVYYGGIEKDKYVISENTKYEYDKNGNIVKIYENGALTVRYGYDSIDRLIREDNKKIGFTALYAYDNCGNILCKRQTAFTLKENAEECEFTQTRYGYEGDKLLTFGGEVCEYDEIGNPILYRGKVAEWEKGRQLRAYNGTRFAYDGSGRRISKNGITYTYDGNGNLISDSNGIEYLYDNSGIFAVKYQNSTYFYRKDVQGNVISLLDENGAVVVKYIYDAWGNHAVLDGAGNDITDDDLHIGNLNPFRYRGYFYDPETELYYLQTRYYDPETGRFITIDAIEYLDPETINGLNLYAYCGDNPVMGYDPDGTWDWGKFWKNAFGFMIGLALVVVAVLGAISIVASGGSLLPIFVGAIVGAAGNFMGQGISNVIKGKGFFDDINYFSLALGGITGAAFATGVGGLLGAVAIGGASSAGLSAFENKSWNNILFDCAIGGIAGGVGHGLSRFVGKVVYKNGDLGFSDFYQLAKLDTNVLKSAGIALRSSYYTFFPMVSTGLSRFLINFFGKKGGGYIS